MRLRLLALLAPLVVLLPAPAGAVCPSNVNILGSLTCSSTQSGSLNIGAPSYLGNTYTCGTPYAPLAQNGPEDVYEFQCQTTGSVNLDITNLSCDIDIYILNVTCNPNTGCQAGSTAASTTNDSVTFTCTSGQLYYVVIEGYEVPYGLCNSGASYTLTFDVSQSTGCPEDCNDGIDNDFDSFVDCDDPDCYGDPSCDCDNDGDGYDGLGCGGDDCNDANAAINPGAFELCDGLDNNCNGLIDEGYDNDGDGYRVCDGDCDDNDPGVHPGAVEIPYDGIDQDCDGADLVDVDGDGFIGAQAGGPDCDDTDASVHPGATEEADFVDDDCDGDVDEGTEHYDDDGDGFTELGGDCNDGDAFVHPAAYEICNPGVDDDCDGVIDEGTECFDDDGDGLTELDGDCNDGDANVFPGQTEILDNGIDDDCDGVVDLGEGDADGDGYTESGGDCLEGDPTVFPGAAEICDSKDNDCDGEIDEGTECSDDDGDGFTEQDGDCHDADPAVNPDATDTVNGIDDDCDGDVDEGTDVFDDDGDGLSEQQGDCDDDDATVYPGADEAANGIDDDCDDEIDEGLADADSDGFTEADGDCDDSDGWANPDVPEMCDGVDNDCDGEVDEGLDCQEVEGDDGDGPANARGGCDCNTGGGSAALGSLLLLLGLRRRRSDLRLLARVAPLLLLIPTLGCEDEVAVNQVPKTLSFGPEFTDLGTVYVGQTLAAEVLVTQLSGAAIAVDTFALTNHEGEFFSLPELELLELDRDVVVPVEVRYAPQVEGYHWASVLIETQSQTPAIEVVLRANAVLPDLQVTPLALDFGNVLAGADRTMATTVINGGELAIDLLSVESGNPAFAPGTGVPTTVPAGGSVDVDVVFTAGDDEPAYGSLVLGLEGGLSLGPVLLRGNDCELGIPSAYDEDGDGYTTCGGDCDDFDPEARPGLAEEPDLVDNDCDGIVDEGTILYDDDGDGFSEVEGDCNDANTAVSPAELEADGNGIDDDCDGVVDAGIGDVDGDGYAPLGGDCDDGEPTVFPGAPELADGLDNDCDGLVDEGTPVFDDDGDGLAETMGDCDDTNPAIFTGALEIPDWADNDCDGEVDEGTVHADDDGDGYTELGGDCNDGDPAIGPNQLEIQGNFIDDDCDGITQ